MRINRFFTSTTLAVGKELLLEESVSHHMIKVLRFKAGTKHILFNGQDGQYLAEFLSAEKKQARVKVISFEQTFTESVLHLHLLIAISKGDRMDWVMQKSTELGVTEITPVYTEYSDHKLKADRLEKKMRHWQQVMISACEQSGRTSVPALNPVIAIEQLADIEKADFNWVMHPGEKDLQLPSDNLTTTNLLVGPEGGFSGADIEQAVKQGFTVAAVGPRIFRTETAPIVAITMLQQQYGDF